MNTEQFYRRILPATGLKILAELVTIPGMERPAWRYTTYQSFEAMAEATRQIDSKHRTIYHACNAFGDWYVDDRTNKRRLRTQQNVTACRALYDDVDTGKPGSYPDRAQAGAAVKQFLANTNLPVPLIVSSGAGLHLYWTLDQDIDPATWQRLSEKKRSIARHFKFLTDPACDLDSARVLRPVGSTWRKQGDRPVTCKHPGETVSPEELEARLDACIAKHHIEEHLTMVAPAWMQNGTGNLADHGPDFPPSFLANVAKHCAQIRLFKETGSHSEPHWHACAGIAAHCKDGHELFHTWSATYDGYSRAEAQSKLDNWSAGPTTCEKLRSLDPAPCAGCPHQCKSPVQLGQAEAVEAPPPELPPAPAETSTEAPPSPEFWPPGYVWDPASESVRTTVKDENGVAKRATVVSPLIYVTDTIQHEDGTFRLGMEAVVRGRREAFELETKHTADPKTLAIWLATKRITAMNHKLTHDFVLKQLIAARQRKDQVNTYVQFGWHHENSAFLIGNQLITADATNPVRISSSIPPKLASIYGQSGDAETWIKGVNELYNRPATEPYQLLFCLAFGGILGPFMPSAQWRGIPYALTSDTSGIGKSTACKIALNIYGQADKTMMANSTAKGLIGRTGTMGNIPFLMDEVTANVTKPEEMSDLLYALSNGQSRVGMTSEGTERRGLPEWNVPVIITGNRNIMQQVCGHDIAPEATQMRVFEVDVDSYPHLPALNDSTELGANHKLLSDELIANHYGVVGEAWIRYVITHQAEITERLAKVSQKLRRAVSGGNASMERYYYDLATMMLVGGYYARKLGYLQFDLNNLRDWIIKHIARLRNAVNEHRSSPEDQFARLMSDLNGKLIITKRFDTADRRSGTTCEVDQGNVRGPVEGRVVLGDPPDDPPRVYVARRFVTQWCAKAGINYTRFKRDMLALKLLRTGPYDSTPGISKVTLGKGVFGFEHIGQADCFEFSARAASAHLAVVPATSKTARK